MRFTIIEGLKFDIMMICVYKMYLKESPNRIYPMTRVRLKSHLVARNTLAFFPVL